jgi:hypothetical protein
MTVQSILAWDLVSSRCPQGPDVKMQWQKRHSALALMSTLSGEMKIWVKAPQQLMQLSIGEEDNLNWNLQPENSAYN